MSRSRGDLITAIVDVDDGGVDETGRREIDAEGRLVTPGFVDIHTHLDAQIAWDPIGSSSCWHGVTSVVMGNCGVTFAPCRPDDRATLAAMMESVEDIPAQAILDSLPWDWETYGEYYDSIDRLPKGPNTGGLVGHCALRTYVMGERGLDEAPATGDDVVAMVAARRRGDGRRCARRVDQPHVPASRPRWPAGAGNARHRRRTAGVRRGARPASTRHLRGGDAARRTRQRALRQHPLRGGTARGDQPPERPPGQFRADPVQPSARPVRGRCRVRQGRERLRCRGPSADDRARCRCAVRSGDANAVRRCAVVEGASAER